MPHCYITITTIFVIVVFARELYSIDRILYNICRELGFESQLSHLSVLITEFLSTKLLDKKKLS
jgi:hypothetical protein